MTLLKTTELASLAQGGLGLGSAGLCDFGEPRMQARRRMQSRIHVA